MSMARARIAGMIVALLLGATAGCGSHSLAFESVNPAEGRLGGGEEVRIRGAGFEHLANIDVRIGGRMATNVGVVGDDTIVLTSPEGRDDDANHPTDISILTSDGKSIVLRHAFTYRPGASRGPAGPNEDLRRRL
jgi:hypothetical protein